jgi:hypothetical protein
LNYKKGCTRLAAASDKVYQLLAHGRWMSAVTPVAATSKTGRHDIAEILLKATWALYKYILKKITNFSLACYQLFYNFSLLYDD